MGREEVGEPADPGGFGFRGIGDVLVELVQAEEERATVLHGEVGGRTGRAAERPGDPEEKGGFTAAGCAFNDEAGMLEGLFEVSGFEAFQLIWLAAGRGGLEADVEDVDGRGRHFGGADVELVEGDELGLVTEPGEVAAGVGVRFGGEFFDFERQC